MSSTPAPNTPTRTAAEVAREFANRWPQTSEGSYRITPDGGVTYVQMLEVLVREAEERGAARERALCLADIEGERLTGETGEEADLAYNQALGDAKSAILNRVPAPTVGTPGKEEG